MAGAAGPHFRCIRIKYSGIVCFAVNGEEIDNFRIDFIPVVFAGFLGHSDAAVRLQGTFKRFVSLKTDDLFKIGIQITGTM